MCPVWTSQNVTPEYAPKLPWSTLAIILYLIPARCWPVRKYESLLLMRQSIMQMISPGQCSKWDKLNSHREIVPLHIHWWLKKITNWCSAESYDLLPRKDYGFQHPTLKRTENPHVFDWKFYYFKYCGSTRHGKGLSVCLYVCRWPREIRKRAQDSRVHVIIPRWAPSIIRLLRRWLVAGIR